ncbi:MAG: TetR/AcrR family transcriptional regulator [Spartobacteria bacterium]|nr:TetR/AcrR family transcriptional regulator [Spartobacteria bacterium]
MNTKEQILLDATRLFAAEGYENIGVQRIVTSVHVTKPSLYHHFGSKKGLLEAIFAEHLNPFLRDLKACTTYQHDLEKNVVEIATLFFTFAKNHPEFYRFMLSTSFSPKDSELSHTVYPFLVEMHSYIQAMFLAAEKDHGNMRGRSDRYALSFIGMLNSYIASWFYGQLTLSGDSAFQACRQFLHGIFS